MNGPLQAGMPELGPLLGDLAAAGAPGERDAELEPIRLEMLTALFERAGRARHALATGDVTAARSALAPEAWLAAWDTAVAAAGATLLGGIERRLHEAAAVSRMPAKRVAARLPDADERRALSARLSSAGIGLEEATRELANPAIEWNEAIRRTSGELTGAWEKLRSLARAEQIAWDRRAAQIRAWRRPWRPLVVTGLALIGVAVWIGLVLGGFVPVPEFMRPAAEWYWDLPWP